MKLITAVNPIDGCFSPFGKPALLALLLCASTHSTGQQTTNPPDSDDSQSATETEEEERIFGLGWLDTTQEVSSQRANALARQLDRFFGVERSDLEAAYSSLRLTTEVRWEEANYIEPRVRLRGRLHLPRINERLSLIFSEDQGEGTSYYSQNPSFVEEQSTRVNLEVNLGERDKDRWDFRVGLRSSGKLRTSLRYRYEDGLTDNLFHRLSETIYFIDGTGYGSFTQYQLDRALTLNSLLRWSTEFRVQENLDGNEWATSASYLFRNSDSSGITYYASMNGNSKDSYVGRYQVGMRIRRNFARPWLFWEFLPGYQWEKVSAESSREGGVFAAIRLEMAIGTF